MTDTTEDTGKPIVIRRGKKSTFIPRQRVHGDNRNDVLNETSMPLKASMFLVDTMYLTHEQRSSYITLLVVTWNQLMPLPDDNAQLGRLCGMTGNRFVKCVRGKIEKFFEIRGGYWRPSAGHVEDPNCRRLNVARWSALKQAIMSRDNYTCAYCGRKPPDVKMQCDHIVPLSRGGSNDPENLTAACFECNSSKGAKLLEEWIGDRS